MTTLDDLNARVTAAILSAERADEADKAAAYKLVSELEEALAAETRADSVEGTAARLGAVTAAIRADKPLRACMLIERYSAEALPPRAEHKLRALEVEMVRTLVEQSQNAPLVEDVQAILPAA